MFPKNMQDPEYPSYTGDRADGQNLVLEWTKNKKVNGRFYWRAHQVSVWVWMNAIFHHATAS